MSSPTPSITKVRYHGRIVDPATGRPAKGHLLIDLPQALMCAGDLVVLGPKQHQVELDGNGEFAVWLYPTDHPQISPSGWTYTVTVLTDVWHRQFALSVPVATQGTLELALTAPATTPSPVVVYALASALASYLSKAGGTLTGPLTLAGVPTSALHAATKKYVDDLFAGIGTGGGGSSTLLLKVCNVEDPQYAGGAKGNGVTDDYPAIRAAHDAALAAEHGGLVLFPRAVSYRVDLDVPGRVAPTVGGAYAAFPLPMITTQDGPLKRTFGWVGVGDPYSVRTATTFGADGSAAQVATASVLLVDYSGTFTWSAQHGLPSVLGGPDADATGHATDNVISNLHWTMDGLIIRQPPDPSLCAVNLEMISTVNVRSLRVDVDVVLDHVPEPTHPTGAAIVLPKSNNNVAVRVDSFIAEGHYTGLLVTEHADVKTAIMLRCKIGVANRRPCTHAADLYRIKVEQCPWGFAGWNPAGTGPNGGIVPWLGATIKVNTCNFEHFGYLNAVPWIYTPARGADVYAPNGGLSGQVTVYRVNSETPSPIGVPPYGGSGSVYVVGVDGGTNLADFAIYTYSGGSAQRLLGHHPVNNAPAAPTIGVATAGDSSATVTFTPAAGAAAERFTATARDGDGEVVGTATGATSPLTITGLPPGVPVTIRVRATNPLGTSPESAASNPVTPTGGLTAYSLMGGLTGPSTSNSEGSAINLGVEFKVTQPDCLARAIRFWRGNLDVAGAITGRLWVVTGVGTGVFVAGSDVTFVLSGTGWQEAQLDAPIVLDTAVRYVAVVHFPDRWCSIPGFWSPGGDGADGLTAGPLTAHNNAGAVNGQGPFGLGSITDYPALSGNGGNYLVDVLISG